MMPLKLDTGKTEVLVMSEEMITANIIVVDGHWRR